MKRIITFCLLVMLVSGCSPRPIATAPATTTVAASTPVASASTPEATAPATYTPAPTSDEPTGAEKAVIAFFEAYAAKDIDRIDSVLVASRRETVWNLDGLLAMELISYEEVADNEDEYIILADYEYPDAYDRAVVKVEFSVEHAETEYPDDTQTNGTFTWRYKLVQETSDSDWLIFDWGV